jgi:tRNA(Ile)-lysidine synthase TilS/MesJ
VIRPLLSVRRATLRKFLTDSNRRWREDSSNASPSYLRNRLRAALKDRDDVTETLLDLSRACAKLKQWTERHASKLDNQFSVRQLQDLPAILARHSAAEWLRRHHVPAELIDRQIVDRLRTMCTDAASAAQQQFPGGVIVRRRAGTISAK